ENLVHPEDLESARRSVQRALQEGSFEGEWRVILPDASVHWLFARGRIFKDSPGEPQRLLGVNIDVTERRVAENTSRESRNQLALALKSSKAGLFEWDLVKKRGRWNRGLTAIYGFAPDGDEIDAEGWQRLFHPGDVSRLAEEA